MIARIRKSMQEKDQGFTLIELLVVMIIIGILAAIAIPVFLNQRKKANDTAAKSDVGILGKELATYYVDEITAAPTISNNATTHKYTWTGLGDLGPSSKNVTTIAQGFSAADATTGDPLKWCVQVNYTSGTKTSIAYGSTAGLGALGSTCEADGDVVG